MSQRERRLILFMAAIFAVYFLPFILWPAIASFYENQTADTRQLREDIARYERLDEQGQRWQETHAQMLEERDQVETSLLEGATQDLVGARLQSTLTELSKKHSLQVQSTNVPEFKETGQWLMVSLTMNFSGAPNKTMAFLKELHAHQTFLAVTRLDLRANRANLLSGNVTVTGFSHLLNGHGTSEEDADATQGDA